MTILFWSMVTFFVLAVSIVIYQLFLIPIAILRMVSKNVVYRGLLLVCSWGLVVVSIAMAIMLVPAAKQFLTHKQPTPAFDPDAYLKGTKPKDEFDPSAYLQGSIDRIAADKTFDSVSYASNGDNVRKDIASEVLKRRSARTWRESQALFLLGCASLLLGFLLKSIVDNLMLFSVVIFEETSPDGRYRFVRACREITKRTKPTLLERILKSNADSIAIIRRKMDETRSLDPGIARRSN